MIHHSDVQSSWVSKNAFMVFITAKGKVPQTSLDGEKKSRIKIRKFST